MRSLITVTDAARILNVSEYRVYALVRNGLLPAVRLGKLVRFDEEALKQWIASGGEAGNGKWRKETVVN